MKRYEVTVRVPGMPVTARVVRAPSAQAAYAQVRDASMQLRSGRAASVTVRRVGRTKVFAVGGRAGRHLHYRGPFDEPPDDGLAGVREPRRPRPSPSSAAAQLPVPGELEPQAHS
ncbi:MAG: hypothetical protein V9F82_03935 [Dermatophilaceae bacterium]